MDTNNLILSQEDAEQMQNEDLDFITTLYGRDCATRLTANSQSGAKIIAEAMNKHIAQIRKSKKISQIELAKRAGISVNSLRLYEAGKRSPTFATLQKIADALGVQMTDIIKYGYQKYLESEPSTFCVPQLPQSKSMEKLSISEAIKRRFVQFKSDDDKIAYLYSLLNDSGKFEAARCFFRHLDKDSIPEVIDYLQQLADTPQYQNQPKK